MAIKKRIDSVELIVFPLVTQQSTDPNDAKFKENWLSAAHQLEKEILKHCNDVGPISIRVNTTEYCEFCGHPHNEPYYCCQKSIDEIAEKEKKEFGL